MTPEDDSRPSALQVILTAESDSNWWRLILMYGRTGRAGAFFFCLGSDSDLPFRPWVQHISERRGKNNNQRADWLALLGVCIGWQRITNGKEEEENDNG